MQKIAFLDGEADRYFERNADHLLHLRSDAASDPVLRALRLLKPATMLEVGCANGWRLDAARELWECHGTGIDPSAAAIRDGRQRFPHLALSIGTADALPMGPFDCIVFGFCLYLCDRTDLFRIAAEADRALIDRGYLVVYDFFPAAPHRNPYSHRPGVFSYKMDYSGLWRWHPSYTMWHHEVTSEPGEDPNDPSRRLAVTVLKKG